MLSLDSRSQSQEFETRTVRIPRRRATYSTVALCICVEEWSGRRGSRHSNVAIGRAVCVVSICSVAVSIVGRSARSALAIVQQNVCCAAKDSRVFLKDEQAYCVLISSKAVTRIVFCSTGQR
jgi:hypothetical protein